jgi:hypothetical protein
MKNKISLLCLLFYALNFSNVIAQSDNSIPHLQRTNKNVQFILNGRPFLMLAGEVHNSSSSSLEYMEKFVWPELVALNCNTAIVPVM